jgi:hypothetical protein
MNLQAEKLQLIEWLASLQDHDVVKRLLEVQRSSKANPEVAIPGLPVTTEETDASIAEAEEQIARGEYYTIDQVKSQAAQWLNIK